MDNPQKQATLAYKTQDKVNKRQRKPKEQSSMDNPEKQATLSIQDTGQSK